MQVIGDTEDVIRKLYQAKAHCDRAIDWLLRESFATFLPYRDPERFAGVLGGIARLDSFRRAIVAEIKQLQSDGGVNDLLAS